MVLEQLHCSVTIHIETYKNETSKVSALDVTVSRFHSRRYLKMGICSLEFIARTINILTYDQIACGLGVYYLINDHVNECNNFARLKTHLRQFWHEFILTFFNWSLSNNSISNWYRINKDRFSLHLHLPINYLRKLLIFLDIPQNLSYILLILFEDFIKKERNKLL